MKAGIGTRIARCAAHTLVVMLGCAFVACETQRRRSIEPTRGQVTLGSAEEATAKGDWRAAASHWHEIYLRGGEHQRVALLRTAQALTQLGDRESAKNLIEQGFQLWPNDSELYELHGDLLSEMGFNRAAEMSYVHALDVEPDRISVLRKVACVRIDLGLDAGARGPLARLIELGAANAETHLLAARAALGCGDLAQAFEHFDKAFLLAEPAAEDLAWAGALYADERVRNKNEPWQQKAQGWLERAVALDPQNTRAYYVLGLVLDDRGEHDRAFERYYRAVETDPSYVPALIGLASAYMRRGERAKATELVERAKRLEKDPGRRASFDRVLADTEAESKSDSKGDPA